MAGNVRRDFKCSVTHLVANVIGGEKYDVSLYSQLLFLKVKVHPKLLTYYLRNNFSLPVNYR